MSKKPKRKVGRPKGKSPGVAITSKKISDAFDMYCDKKNISQIARKLNISRSTVARHRNLEGWDKRRKLIQEKAIRRVDNKIAVDQGRHITLSRAMQQKGGARLLTLTDDDISARDAREFIKDGIMLEREISGGGGGTIQITIKLPLGLEDM
jgi:hypothetical protein